MTNSKNPYLRYRLINACFVNRQHKYWTRDELLAKLAEHDLIIEARTLDFDIENMRHSSQVGFHAPIQYCRRNKGYYYTDENYSIEAIALAEEELQSLQFASQLVQQYKGSMLVNRFNDVVDKVIQAGVTRKKKSITQPSVECEVINDGSGIIHLEIILSAVHKQQPLRITYRKFGEEKSVDHIFHPYFLKEYEGRWYVLGRSETRNIVLTLALDRMVHVKEADTPFINNTRANTNDYFKHTLGVTLGKGKAEEIKLWFSKQQAYYIKSKPLHDSQHVLQEDETGLILTVALIPNYELTSRLLSFGNAVKVLAPKKVCDDMKEKLESAFKNY